MGKVGLDEGSWHIGCLASSVHKISDYETLLWEKQGTWYPIRHRSLKSSTFFPHKNSLRAVPYWLYLLYPQSLAYIAPGTWLAPSTCWMTEGVGGTPKWYVLMWETGSVLGGPVHFHSIGRGQRRLPGFWLICQGQLIWATQWTSAHPNKSRKPKITNWISVTQQR